MKLMIIFGTRPEVIKLAPVILAATEMPGLEVVTCSTGRQRHMLDQALQCFDLQSRCTEVRSDSGGIQEHAPSFGVPCVVMREHTERREGIDAGSATLSGTDPAQIVQAAHHWLGQPQHRQALAGRPNPYGDGQASRTLLAHLA